MQTNHNQIKRFQMTDPSFPSKGFRFKDAETYVFHEKLGQGGHGTVFRIANESGRFYACKMFSSDIIENPEKFHKFKRESQIGINISHEHLVSFHKSLLINGSPHKDEMLWYPAIIMDYVNGFDLWTFKKMYERAKGRFPRHYAALILAKSCSGLDFLHQLNIRHGDIKPGNILISQTGFPKVTDYGIAVVGAESAEAEGGLRGTVRYLAPEQIRRAGNEDVVVDLRADLYSIGIVALELTVGLPEYLYGNYGKVMNYIVHNNADLLGYVDKTPLPPDLKFVIKSCLHENLRRRPSNLRELQNVLLHTIYGTQKGITLEDIGDVVQKVIQ